MKPSRRCGRCTTRPPAQGRLLRPVLLCAALAAVHPARAAPAPDLTSLSLENLMELTVVGASKYEQKQSEVAAAVSVITRQEIQAFGWRTLDAALASLPGVHTTYDRQYHYLGNRGFGLPGDYTTRVLVTINGNRVNEPVYDSGPVGNLFPLDMALVERIEYIPGPGGAVYGQNAMFGVVNVVTRSGAGVDGVEIAAAAQSPQELVEGRLTWGRRLDNGVEVLLSATALEARGEDRVYDFGSAGVSGLAAGMDGERDREIFARIGRGAWSFDLVYGDRRKDDPTGAYFSDPLVAGQNQSDRYALAQFQYQESFRGDTLQLLGRLFAGQEDYDSRLSYGTPFQFPATGRWHGGELRLLSTAMADHKWMLGLELQNNTVIRQAVHDVETPANDIVISGSGSRAGLYAQDEWRFADGWIATLGLRVDHDDTTGTKTSPRAALIWQAAPATTLKALYGRAHRAPNAYERDYDDGFAQVANPALRGESITTLELVADQRVGTDLALRAAAYQWTMQGLITLGIDPVSGVTQYQSGDTVKARGLELSADKTWTAGARLRGSLALQDVAYAGGGAPLNSPEVLAKLNLSAPLPWAGLHAGYEIRYDSGRLSVDGTQLGGYAVSNLHLRTEALAPGLGLALSMANVFDKRHAHPGADSNWQNAIDQDGRTVRVQLDYRF